MSKILWISPHDDDSTLFGAFTCLREKPDILVCLDSWIQPNRGEKGCDAETRAKESEKAHDILGCKTLRLGIRDDEVTMELLEQELSKYNYDKIYAPQIYEYGNLHHNMIGIVCSHLFKDKVIFYPTYSRHNLYETGNIEVIPTPEELELKNKALQCYTSQINLPSTRPHFLAILGRSEWLI